jgi:hypothetical protein
MVKILILRGGVLRILVLQTDVLGTVLLQVVVLQSVVVQDVHTPNRCTTARSDPGFSATNRSTWGSRTAARSHGIQKTLFSSFNFTPSIS